MRGTFSRSVRLIALILALLVSCFSTALITASAEDEPYVVENIVTHDIAIVFDNSGSMYENESWCQALYAMEVFASMIDYKNDKLGIYPMGPIQIGKSGESIDERLDISSEDDVKDIEKIYSKRTSDTILRPAYSAVEYLKESELDEKWLIVLTDGEFFYDKDTKGEERSAKSAEWLSGKLMKFAKSSDINVQYLGFAEATPLNSNESKHFYATNANTADQLTGELVNICNKIFQRNQVSSVSSSGDFSIDVSMKSIIAFVQGKGAKINSLKTSDGEEVSVAMDTRLEASTEGTGNKKYPAPVADVAGQVVTYSDCPAGSYKLDHVGSNVQILYEPNVVVNTVLLGEDGKPVDLTKSVEPGEYTLQYGLIDPNSKTDVTNSSLLSPVSLSATVKNNGETQENVASGTKIVLTPDSTTEIDVRGTYLTKYNISNECDGDIFKINVDSPNASDLDVDISITNLDFGYKWYKLSDHENWEPIRIDVTYKGEPLTDEQLADALILSITPKEYKLSYKVEQLKGESAYNIYIGINEQGKYLEPEQGDYSIDADVTIIDKNGIEVSNSDSDGFEIRSYSSIWLWLIWVILLVLLIALIIFILNLPVWPRHMRFVVEKPKDDEGLKATIRIRSTNMPVVPYEDALYCKAKKNSKVKDWLFKPKGMSIIASNFSSEEIQMFSIGGHTYTQKDGELVCRGVNSEIIFNGSSFKFTFLNGTKGSGHIEIY